MRCEHWKLIVTIIIVVVAAALLWTGVGGVLLAGACWGALSGAVIGGVAGGLTSVANGEGFLEGFEDGAFSGALSGAICGAAFAGLGQLGAVCGRSIKCASSFGKAIRGTAAVTKGISIAMGGFDTLALADLAFGPGTIYNLNSKLHSNKAYNIFQTGVSALAVFTGGMKATMKCFIAGTLIAAESGFARIESIKPGDVVLSTNADTMETGYKKVLEKYVRKTRELVHIIAGGEEIVSTPDHPYYVEGRGFVNACQLCIGSPLMDADGKILEIEQIYKEQLEKNEEVTVYNFQVEDWHTYHVGEMEVMVHNAEYEGGRETVKIDEFFIDDWTGYPDAPKPDGPFRILEGTEYTDARNLANKTNANIHRNRPDLKGTQIHEMHPVKLGGSPTDIDNKIALSPKEHAKYTAFWNKVLREQKGKLK